MQRQLQPRVPAQKSSCSSATVGGGGFISYPAAAASFPITNRYTHSKKKKRTQVSSVIVTFQGHPSTQSLLPCRAQFISHKQSSILCRLLSSSLPPTFPSQFFLEGVISQKLKKKKNGVEREEPQMSLAEKDMLQAEYVCSTSKLVC